MTGSPFLPHFSNAITSFPCNPTKIPTPVISCSSSKYSIVTVCSSPNNGSNSPINEGRSIGYESKASCMKSSESIPHSRLMIKAPTAPWMNEPLLVKPSELESMKPRTKRGFSSGRKEEHSDVDLTGKVGGGRGRLAMKKVLKGIENLQETHNLEETTKAVERRNFKFAPGVLCGKGDYESNVEREEDHEPVQEKLESNEFDIPLSKVEREVKLKKFPWETDEKMIVRRVKKEKLATAAELSLDGVLLGRLRDEAALIRKWVKVMKAGVTQAVVDQVHFTWRNNELALLKFEIPLSHNMDRAREIIEMKTGGLVVWRNKAFLAVYRGLNYGSDSKYFRSMHKNSASDQGNSSSTMKYRNVTYVAPANSDKNDPDQMIHEKDDKGETLHMASLYEREGDRLLDGLGPRFVDWWMHKPLPVDGDLLPELVPGYKTPFRRLSPPFTRSKLTDAELTYLRKLARPLPTHFVLGCAYSSDGKIVFVPGKGRNRNLQGLAAAIIRLWEKCHIAKIALKWGVQNTDNEQMADELKRLTGGVLLLRNKFLIILYRGNDFIPSGVAKVVTEREVELTRCQLEEEAARIKASERFSISDEHLLNPGIMGTLSEFHSIDSEISVLKKEKTEVDIQLEAEKERLKNELKDQERSLLILKGKIERSVKELEKLKNESKSSEKDPDMEIISKEERVCLQEMGSRLDSSLVLGRRGVYDGVIEGMHQHWKHREIVKVITMQKKISQVMHSARFLEAESGGILIDVIKLKKGHAIIVYRGKNYKRPKSPASNLLNKKEALSRSLEIQRLGSLKFFAKQREQTIFDLKRKLAELSDKKH